MSYKELKKAYSKEQLAVFFLKEYLKYGTLVKIGNKYNVSHMTLYKIINDNLEYIEKNHINLHKKYISKIEKNKRIGKGRKSYSSSSSNKRLFKLLSKEMETLPKEIRYKDFLEWCINHSTENLTGIQLIELAKINGVKVVG
ncbi:hypothetical protein U732_1108 [Clostridium argentinense CDC 2741]|uniref:Uncharacterized protein n=1 Tax=Clostridium argentinense CDC 2741 TaxID=1418104 RepID=A0A0C1UJ02_9CLOT|nr:hypothetical protein [Clostridium argentinense]ARC85655.1 hypothetical protein RSJ17_14640 [Clostridium argentinense]KIE47265.1 hypothetical protein U732_1108 [Clostridium argentinense CDC 2741]NFF40822.1 hypothetical protein [Clostridium argentinense]NFP50754.1 hypothetical protein [Clostridium argentinense]NFP73089.1 hypothetical protein [Clostridium argentinense]